MSKTNNQRRNEVREWTIRKGWRGESAPKRTFGDDMALLHSEVSEAIEAYRLHGLHRWIQRDGTLSISDHKIVDGPDDYYDFGPQKPEGVASELADVLIRLLDNYAEHDLGVEDFEADIFVAENEFDSFGDAASQLHASITACYEGYSAYQEMSQAFRRELLSTWFDHILFTLQRVAAFYEIDLAEEYEAKMKYNETRENRHGGKKL